MREASSLLQLTPLKVPAPLPFSVQPLTQFLEAAKSCSIMIAAGKSFPTATLPGAS